MRTASEPIIKYYLVNYDSVNQEGIDGIETLNPSDNVVIFYIDKQHTMELSFFERIHSSSANIQFNKVSDESLYPCIFSAYIGYIMGSSPNAHIYIISHDNRYEFLKEFWSEKYEIFIKDSISNTITENPVQDTISETFPEDDDIDYDYDDYDDYDNEEIVFDEFDEAVKSLNLSKYVKSMLRDVFYGSAGAGNRRPKSLQRSLVRNFGEPDASEYYQVLEPLITTETVPEAKPDNVLSGEIEQVLQPFNLSKGNKIFLRNLINESRQEYPYNKKHRCSRVFQRMQILINASDIYNAIEPYI